MARVSEQLARAGYSLVAQVGAPVSSRCAVRCSMSFPMGYAQPLRIDLFDDAIDSIRHFDPDTQRSLGHPAQPAAAARRASSRWMKTAAASSAAATARASRATPPARPSTAA